MSKICRKIRFKYNIDVFPLPQIKEGETKLRITLFRLIFVEQFLYPRQNTIDVLFSGLLAVPDGVDS